MLKLDFFVLESGSVLDQRDARIAQAKERCCQVFGFIFCDIIFMRVECVFRVFSFIYTNKTLLKKGDINYTFS